MIALLLLLEAFVVLSAGALGLIAGYRLSRWQSPLPSRAEVSEALSPRKELPKPEPEPVEVFAPRYAINPEFQK
jgi:hypothetical protein